MNRFSKLPTSDSEERMRSVVDHVVDGIITINAEGTVTTFNRAAERIFGYHADEVVGRNVKLLMPEPYHGEHDGYIASYLSTGRAKIIGIGREVVGRRKDGSAFPMELAISEFRLGEDRYFTGIVRDITERKRAEQELREAEERMRSVVNHVVDGIITIDAQGNVESFNPAAEKLFGYWREEVIGRNVRMLMPEPYHAEHDGYIRNYLASGQAKIIGIGREVTGRRKDGSTFPMDLAVSEFHIAARRYFTGIVRDITERKRLQDELKQRLVDLAEADRQKNDFLAMLSHELRNPLAPLRNALYLLKTQSGDPETAEVHGMMERQLQQLVRLVDDLLDVSRIIRGKIELRKERIDLAQAVQRAAETAKPVIDAHGHVLNLAIPERPIHVVGDMIRLAQVVSNLLTNAAKYSRVAAPIDLILRREGEQAVIVVKDRGIGIPPALLPRVFDLFVQGEHALARSQGGLGIGLTLVKRLVEMHDGTVSAASAGDGQGSEFQIRMPALTEEAQGAARAAPPTAQALAGRRVLVVDDNIDAAESIARILRLFGHEVQCQYDGPSALAAVPAYRPDIIVLDIGLPGMDGYQVARELRAMKGLGRVQILAITGYGQEDDRRRSREAGFDQHLTKPVDPALLESIVGAVSPVFRDP
ncbi:MAG TPA: PAS domain S-box protein [Burkholderiaceae bacterium]|nr:PAS domain S-box protein [Burkholderiaceae bacterium]